MFERSLRPFGGLDGGSSFAEHFDQDDYDDDDDDDGADDDNNEDDDNDDAPEGLGTF